MEHKVFKIEVSPGQFYTSWRYDQIVSSEGALFATAENAKRMLNRVRKGLEEGAMPEVSYENAKVVGFTLVRDTS